MQEDYQASLNREFKRKAFHLLSLIYLAVYLKLGHPLALYLLAGWMFLVAAVETARLKSPAVRNYFQSVFGGIIREKETGRYTGTFYTTLGSLVTLFFFGTRPVIVNAALLYLSLGDAASAVVGKKWGNHPYKVMGQTRSLEGTAAGFLVAWACGWSISLPPAIALGGAVVFSLADAVPIPPDDNLWIPVITASALLLMGL